MYSVYSSNVQYKVSVLLLVEAIRTDSATATCRYQRNHAGERKEAVRGWTQLEAKQLLHNQLLRRQQAKARPQGAAACVGELRHMQASGGPTRLRSWCDGDVGQHPKFRESEASLAAFPTIAQPAQLPSANAQLSINGFATISRESCRGLSIHSLPHSPGPTMRQTRRHGIQPVCPLPPPFPPRAVADVFPGVGGSSPPDHPETWPRPSQPSSTSPRCRYPATWRTRSPLTSSGTPSTTRRPPTASRRSCSPSLISM